MNIYRTKFYATCPADGCSIEYSLQINSCVTIRVEAINEALGDIKVGFHEDIADRLFGRFGGTQVIRATHQGVEIETIRPSFF